MKLEAFSIGKPKEIQYAPDKKVVTGICKETVQEAFLTVDGFHGDGVADVRHHGGLDRAVCVYPYEHYALWKREFGSPLAQSTFGENFTVSNMLERDIHIGDIFQVGEAVIQVTQSRIPCSTITKRTGLPLLLKRMIETGYTGYLCRVLEEGMVRSDSEITLLKTDLARVSVLFTNEIYFHQANNHSAVKKILEVDALAVKWREGLEKRAGFSLEKEGK